MRLIDADALLKKENHAAAYSGEMLVVGKGYIIDAPTVDAVPVWISVKDKLPEDEALILAYHPHYLIPTPGQKCDVDRITIKFGWYCRKSALGITHWMPLPQPPGAKMDSECGNEKRKCDEN